MPPGRSPAGRSPARCWSTATPGGPGSGPSGPGSTCDGRWAAKGSRRSFRPTDLGTRRPRPPTASTCRSRAIRSSRMRCGPARSRLGRHSACAWAASLAPFTGVAAANPYAWFPRRRSAEEITTPSADNRLIGFPYTKYLNAVIATDQAASIVMMSAARARSLGVPRRAVDVTRWGGHQAAEQAYMVSERPDLGACPAMQDSSRSALHNGGVGLDRVDIFDFYSCFPVAVEMACDMLGLDESDDRGFTVTGGLPCHGGPGSRLHPALAGDNGPTASPTAGGDRLVTGNGTTSPPAARRSGRDRPNRPNPPAPTGGRAILAQQPLPVVESADGPCRVDSYTVMHDRASRQGRHRHRPPGDRKPLRRQCDRPGHPRRLRGEEVIGRGRARG